MSIDQIKRQAKRLSRLLPAHLNAYPDPSLLSACQELAAQSNGYPSFHAAMSKSDVVLEAATLTDSNEMLPSKTPGRYSTQANPKPLQSGVIEYGAKGESARHKGHYWVVDVGFSLKHQTPITMMFFSPLENDDRLAVDGELRAQVFDAASLDASRQDDSYASPGSVVLAMKPEGKPLYGLCFRFATVATLNGSVVLGDGNLTDFDLNAVLLQMVLQPYERFVLREVIHTLDAADMKSRHIRVQPRESKESFLYLLGQVLALKQVVQYGRRAGFDLALRDDSWMLDAMFDVQRFDQDMATVLANVSPPQPKQPSAAHRSSLGSHQVAYGTTGATTTSLSNRDLLPDHELSRNPAKAALYEEFAKVVAWGYDNRVDSVNWGLDLESSRSPVFFCIDGRYFNPPQHVFLSRTMVAMLEVAWQFSTGGSSERFEYKIEQQSRITMMLPATPQRPNDARVRLHWSGIPNDHGAVVTMRIQHLGGGAMGTASELMGYPKMFMSA